MAKLRVIVKQLNKRNSIPAQFPEKNGIVGIVFENTIIEAEEVPNINTDGGKWYKDRDGFFYWGGGVSVIPSAPSTAINGLEKDWWFSFFGIDKLWQISKAENTKVAILDSGLNFNLEPFKQKQNIKFYNAFSDSENRDDCLDNDAGHGTNCAGMLCGAGERLRGVAPNVDLIVIRVTNDSGGRNSKAILTGLRRAIAMQADVISLSFQLPKSDELHTIIKEAYNSDITITGAAGNSGGLFDAYPASYPECLSIGGINQQRRRSEFSTMSNFLDLMGPGEEISSFVGAQEKIWGTSFATPFVAGTIAVLKSIAKKRNIVLSNIQLLDLLKRSADINIPGYNVAEYGFGIINPLRSIELLNKIP